MAAPGILAALNLAASIGGPLIGNLLGRAKPVSKFTDPQQNLQRELIQSLLGGGGAFNFLRPEQATQDFQRQVADPARQQFQNLTIPQIQQRFAGLGQLRGTSAGDTIARSGANLEQALLGQQFQTQQNALDRVLQGLSPAFANQFTGQQQLSPMQATAYGFGQQGLKNLDSQQILNLLQGLGNAFGGGSGQGSLAGASGAFGGNFQAG